MRKNTSFRLEDEIKSIIARNGGASFIEGCVLIVRLANLTALAQRASLEYESMNHPPVSGLTLSDCLQITSVRGEKILRPISDCERVDLSRIIRDISEIPADIPIEYRESIESLLRVFGEREDLNI